MIRFNDILEKVSSLYSEKDIATLQKAYVFTAHAHQGQVRRSGEPYLNHPLEVTSMLADMKLDATTLCAGLLHDVLEDTDITPPELQKAFGKEISRLVEGVTKISLVQESSPEARHAETIRKIILTMIDDLRVIFIKLVDRIHNLKTLNYIREEKQKQIAQETLEIYAPIANRLGMGRIKAELEDLSFRYVNPEEFFKISALADPQQKKAEKDLESLKKALQSWMDENHIPAEIRCRIKRPYSIYSKMKRQDIRFDQVYDFMALRLLTNSVKNCYSALGIIHQKWPHLPYRFRDFIAMPKSNLYQSLHTTIITRKKQTIEIQIRTYDMHNVAENGIAAHWKYKEPRPHTSLKEDKRLQWLRDMVELYKEQKSPREFLKNLKTNLIPEEVYVFTPKGKVVTLPLGATALDFAFRIHSEIGFHAAEAKIDGRPAPLKTILKPGNIVEILTSGGKYPHRDWLNMAFTSSARHQIKHWLNQQEKTKNRILGKKLWEKELSMHKMPSSRFKEDSLVRLLSRILPFQIKKMDDFFALVGSGKLMLNKSLISHLLSEKTATKKTEPFLHKVAAKVTKKDQHIILVKNDAKPMIKLAKCCLPIKGEPITGYMTAGKGITVHSLRCPLIKKEILASQRMVEVAWDESATGNYRATLLMQSKDAPGVLAKVTSQIAQLEGNITKASITTDPNQEAKIQLTLTIRDIRHLNSIIKNISGIKEIFKIERI